MRAAEIIIQEKTANKTQFNNILNNPNVLMGFECEGIAYSSSYFDVEQDFINGGMFGEEDRDDPHFKDLLALEVEAELGPDVRAGTALALAKALNVRCKALETDFPETPDAKDKMNYAQWHIVKDDSLSGDGIPLEIVSAPYPIANGLQMLERTFDFMSHRNIATNSTTGMHISMSIKGKTNQDYDFLKMMLFYDENHVAKLFGRENNQYCQMLRTKLHSEIGDKTFDQYINSNRDLNKIINMLKSQSQNMDFGKYFTIRPKKNGIFEFRLVGGEDYELRYADVKKQAVAMANIMLIGSDDTAFAREYVKKVFDLLDQRKFSQHKKEESSPIDKIRSWVYSLLLNNTPVTDKMAKEIRYEIYKRKLRNEFTSDSEVDAYINTKIIPSTPLQADPVH